MKLNFWKNMNKKDINIEEQTDCQNNVTDMNEEVTENAAADTTDMTHHHSNWLRHRLMS